MFKTRPDVWVALWFLLNVVLVELYNLIAEYSDGNYPTVSWTLHRWFSEWPILAVVIGICLGHLLFALSKPANGAPGATAPPGG